MTISRADVDRSWRPDFTGESDSAPPRTPAPNARRDYAADLVSEPLDRQPVSSDYLAFLSTLAAPRTASDAVASVSAESARDANVQVALDRVRDAFSGPYVVDGSQVTARPMFRMTTHHVPQEIAREVDALAARAGLNGVPSRVGQCSPKELVRITQSLIDAGRLPTGPGDVATRIRRMQWDYGIGVDCAGYSKQALSASALRPPKVYGAGAESFRDLDGARAGSFAKVSLDRARPGDLITLDAPDGGIGHNVVVYSHVVADAGVKSRLAASDPAVKAFLSTPGPHHIIEVDSSWGAGREGAPEGGYRRDTWLYDDDTKTWGSFEPHGSPRRLVTSLDGPADDNFHGIYRPR